MLKVKADSRYARCWYSVTFKILQAFFINRWRTFASYPQRDVANTRGRIVRTHRSRLWYFRRRGRSTRAALVSTLRSVILIIHDRLSRLSPPSWASSARRDLAAPPRARRETRRWRKFPSRRIDSHGWMQVLVIAFDSCAHAKDILLWTIISFESRYIRRLRALELIFLNERTNVLPRSNLGFAFVTLLHVCVIKRTSALDFFRRPVRSPRAYNYTEAAAHRALSSLTIAWNKR